MTDTEEQTPETPASDPFSDSAYETLARAEYEAKHGAIEETPAEEPTEGAPAEEETEQEAAEEAAEEEKPTEAPKQLEKKGRGRPKGDDVLPPDSWTAEGKEQFKTLPKAAQKELRRLDDQFSNWRKRIANELNSERTAVAQERESITHIKAALRPFAEKWAAKGVSETQGLLQLAAFNDAFERDPDEVIRKLAAARGMQVTGGKKTDNPIAQNQSLDHDSVRGLVRQELAQTQQQVTIASQRNAIASGVDSALHELKNEATDEGRYCFPDLHSPEFVNQLSPLVVAIAKKNPELPWREVLLRAYRAADGRLVPKRSAAAGRPQAAQKPNLARRAMTSVRGSGGVPNGLELEFIPNESVEDGIRRAWEALYGPIG